VRKAVIDLGTNTFNLLIAEEKQILFSTKEGVALGMGGINDGMLAEDSMQRGLEALIHFKKHCDHFAVEKIQAIGTSALRDAKNAHVFKELVYNKTGIELRIISGEEEAHYIYKGVESAHVFAEKSVIMDIGGGSTEFIFVHQDKFIDFKSVNIGVSRIFQQRTFQDPYSKEDIQHILNWFETHSESVLDREAYSCLVGSSGSFETVYELIYKKPFPQDEFTSIEIPITLFLETLEWLIHSLQLERDQHPHIISIRRKMAPIAALKMKWIIEKLKIQRVIVTNCSLKEGVLFS
jgi:exopolyphosphatase / guanosine-5'-triphosphate,3'-diphosphate pyrophosphatase